MHTHSTSPFARRLAVLSLISILGACSRRPPESFPSESPASPEAAVAPTVDVTLALDGDPPLPGEAAPGWIGLEQPTAPAHEHGHEGHEGHEGHGGHQGHGGHDEPKPKPKPAPKPAPKPEGAHHHGH